MTPRVNLPFNRKFSGFDVYVYFGDSEHGVPHAHVRRKGEGEAVVAIGDLTTAPWILESSMNGPSTVKALRLVEANQKALRDAWEENND